MTTEQLMAEYSTLESKRQNSEILEAVIAIVLILFYVSGIVFEYTSKLGAIEYHSFALFLGSATLGSYMSKRSLRKKQSVVFGKLVGKLNADD